MARKREDEEPEVVSPYWESSEFSHCDQKEDHFRDVTWIYNNLYLKDVDVKDAPSSGAWFWLQECRENPDALKSFRSYYMKLAPTRKELDERARREDTGGEVMRLIAALEDNL